MQISSEVTAKAEEHAATVSSKSDAFCVKNDAFCGRHDAFCIKNDAFCGRNDAFCIKNDAFCGRNDAFGSRNDAFCSTNDEYFVVKLDLWEICRGDFILRLLVCAQMKELKDKCTCSAIPFTHVLPER